MAHLDCGPDVRKFHDLLREHSHERVLVIGTTCSGKSTLAAQIENAQDMDDLIFPTLSKEEYAYVCQTPWDEEIGAMMSRIVRERIKVEAGKPLFGTVLVECDFAIVLNVNDGALRARTAARNVDFDDAKNMQRHILKEMRSSNIPFVEFSGL